jgi:hypothetical protein
MTNLTKQSIIQEIRHNGWWIMNEKELAEYRSTEIPENYDPNVAIFLSLSHREEINNEWLKKIGKLTDLTDLHIDATNITDDGISELIGLTKLKTLNLRKTRITNKSLKTISQLKSLENLWLNEIALNGQDLQLLGSLENLDSLFLGNGIGSGRADINDNDIEFLFNKESIKSLSLEDTNISSKSFGLFNSLPNLWYLVVTNTNITETEIISFKEQKPKMVIHYIDY